MQSTRQAIGGLIFFAGAWKISKIIMNDAFAKSDPVLKNCESGFSFFFDLIRKECNGQSSSPLHRICTLTRKMGVKAFVREELELNAELHAEETDASVRTGGAVAARAVRLTFFRESPGSGSWRDLASDSILGYAVLVTLALPDRTSRCYILESVVRIPSLWRPGVGGVYQSETLSNYYYHCCREFETKIGTKDAAKSFKVTGSFFCQQNDLTHVCAHAALRMTINSSPAFTGGKLTNGTINRLLGITHTGGDIMGKYGQQTISEGVNVQGMASVIKKLGWEPQVADFVANPAVDYDDFIYPVVESGCPTILGIQNQVTAHVLAVLGHTLNTDRWSPEARHGYGGLPLSPYIGTSAWTDHFIVSDDNFGMYVTLPTDSVRNLLIPKYNPNLHAGIAIGLMPQSVTINGYQTERLAAWMAQRLVSLTQATPDNRWLLLLKVPGQNMVCRTFLCAKKRYLEVMKNVQDDQKRTLSVFELKNLEALLPNEFWTTEITLPNLYCGNKRKLGDILSHVSGSDADLFAGKLAFFGWLPGVAWPKGLLSPGEPWPLFGHVPLLRGASQTAQALEW